MCLSKEEKSDSVMELTYIFSWRQKRFLAFQNASKGILSSCGSNINYQPSRMFPVWSSYFDKG